MSELRKRMIEGLQLRGLAERTQEVYTRAVRQLAAHYHKSPDQITVVPAAAGRSPCSRHLLPEVGPHETLASDYDLPSIVPALPGDCSRHHCRTLPATAKNQPQLAGFFSLRPNISCLTALFLLAARLLSTLRLLNFFTQTPSSL